MGPQGFWGSGDKGHLFSGSWEALVIIFSDLGNNLAVWGIQEALKQVNMTFKNLTLKEKPIFRLTFLKTILFYIDGSYRSKTIVNTEYPRTQNSISL